MKSKLFAILTVGVLMGFSGAAVASGAVGGSPTEADPYCERTRNGSPVDYPGIGWYPEIVPADSAVGPATLMICEGEHWDGQDPLRPDYAADGSCSGQFVDLDNDNYILAVNQCPTPSDNTPFTTTNPVGLRVVAQGDGANDPAGGSVGGAEHGAVYASVRIINVGQAAVFAGGCQEATGTPTTAFGSNGNQDCQGTLGHGVLGVYIQDDATTPVDNTVARVVTILRLTKGFVEEGDCSQAEYNLSAIATGAGEEPTCGRDNTAITIELLA